MGEAAHVEGMSCTAIGSGSHAEGQATVSSGVCSHAQGNACISKGDYSFAGGLRSSANGDYSIALGYYVCATTDSTAAFGAYNKPVSYGTLSQYSAPAASAQTLFSIGNGSSFTRRNMFEIKANGDVYIYGLGNYNGTNSPGNTGYSSTVRPLQDLI